MDLRELTDENANELSMLLGYRGVHKMKDFYYVGRSEYNLAVDRDNRNKIYFIPVNKGSKSNKESDEYAPEGFHLKFK